MLCVELKFCAIYIIGFRFLSLPLIILIPNAGLNPLIYTISAVVLLGTLAIIAIITYWIRVRRRHSNNHRIQSSANPRDHLDYISDNDSTPLTRSELLQERSPTFRVGEENQVQMRPEVGDDDMEIIVL